MEFKNTKDVEQALSYLSGIERPIVNELIEEFRLLLMYQIMKHSENDDFSLFIPNVGTLNIKYKGTRNNKQLPEAVLDASIEFESQFLTDFEDAKNSAFSLEGMESEKLEKVVNLYNINEGV